MPQEYAYFIHIELFLFLSYWFFRFFFKQQVGYLVNFLRQGSK